MSVEKELAELRERLAKVERWKQRKQEIEDELNKVWTEGGEELAPPSYVPSEELSDGKHGEQYGSQTMSVSDQ